MNKKLFVIIFLILILAVGFFINKMFLGNSSEVKNEAPSQQIVNKYDEITATKPDPLEGTILLPTQPIEITFNQPVENGGEFKHQLDPKFEYEIKTSSDRKTVIITPKRAYPLGQTITLIIRPETKFYGGKTLGRDIIYHMQTIQYRGI